ncbi:MAG TPA: manganese efflux pump [Clostridiales bacterium]|jgi:putative Mn2+ efflux pump MntP|nr:manganese efflux pump [Clostridiales bacterium]
MSVAQIFTICLALSMDAFAVAVLKGACMPKFNRKQALLIALFFGSFQAGMPMIGYLIGSTFQRVIEYYDHWVAFVLLMFIGIKMFREGRKEKDKDCCVPFSVNELFVLAIATSIDALAVGVVLAVEKTPILSAGAMIGCTTLVISYFGVVLGRRIGAKFEDKAQMIGGIALILIGTKILIEHLFFY